MNELTVKLSDEELSALKARAKKLKRTLEETATRAILVDLLNEGLIEESAERNGYKIQRLDD